MPKGDVETLFRGGSGRKVACETVIETAPDLPAESFRLPIQDEIDWVNRNAVFERKHSTKGISSPTISNINSASKRFYPNMKSKASIIGLPKRPDSGELRSTFRRSCRRQSIRYYPKPVVKRAEAETEPGSPKVSCIGRVRSKKAKHRSQQRRSQEKPSVARKSRQGKLGFLGRFLAVFRCEGKISVECDDKSKSESGSVEASSSQGKNIRTAVSRIPTTETEVPAVPGLGGLRKFSSGRRSESWGSVELVMDVHVAKPKVSDRDAVWRRRRIVGPLQELDCGRDLERVGPASV